MQILTETWWSPSIAREKSVTVALPTAYSRTGRPLPVLYLLHSFGGNRQSWLQCAQFAAQAEALGMVVVLPESGRFWLINDANGRRYEDYLIREVVPYVDSHFNTIADRSARAIAGFSMGGATALFQTLRHPGIFSVVGSNSGAFEAPLRVGDPYEHLREDERMMMPSVRDHDRVWGPPGSEVRQRYDPYRLLDDRDTTLPVALYLDVGLQDHRRMLAMNRRLRDGLVARSVAAQYTERPGGHDWMFVDAGIERLFSFLRDNVAA